MGGCQSRRKVVTHNSKSDLPLVGFLLTDYSKNEHAPNRASLLLSYIDGKPASAAYRRACQCARCYAAATHHGAAE